MGVGSLVGDEEETLQRGMISYSGSRAYVATHPLWSSRGSISTDTRTHLMWHANRDDAFCLSGGARGIEEHL